MFGQLLPTLLFLLFLATAKDCPDVLPLKEAEGKIRLAQWEEEVDQYLGKGSIKGKAIKRLWRSQVQKGFMPPTFRPIELKLGNTRMVLNPYIVPYALDLPRDFLHGMKAVAQAKGLPPVERFVVVPVKVLVSNGIKNFWSHMFTVVFLGKGGKVLGSHALASNDPLSTQTEDGTIQELGKDEVVLLIVLGDGKATGGESMTETVEMAMAKEKDKEFPDKVHFVQANQGDTGALYEKVSELREKGKKVKKVVVVSHGSPGALYDASGDWSISRFKYVISSVNIPWAGAPEFYFGGCNLGMRKQDEEEIRDFAEMVLPKGGTVRANRYMAAGSGLDIQDVELGRKLYSAYQGLYHASPAVVGGLEHLGLSVRTRVHGVMIGDPKHGLGPTYYEHTSEGSKAPER